MRLNKKIQKFSQAILAKNSQRNTISFKNITNYTTIIHKIKSQKILTTKLKVLENTQK